MADQTTFPNRAPMIERQSSPWTWLIPAIIIAAVIVAYAATHRGNKNTTNTSGTNTTTSQQEPTTTTQPQAVNNVADLGTAAAGTTAQLSNIAINKVVSNRIFTIKSGNSTIYTVLSPSVTLPAQTTLKAGQQVAITGTLVSTNSDQFQNLNLTSTEKTALANQSLVLLVDNVNISNSSGSTSGSTSNTSGNTSNSTNTNNSTTNKNSSSSNYKP